MSRVIVCTGCTSGLGLRALRLVLEAPGSTPTTLIIGSRTLPPRNPLPATAPHEIHYLALDLSSISSTRAFADATRSLLEKRPIDELFLNAGEWKAGVEEAAGGWVDEAVVNHFAQHLLVLVLSPLLAPNNARVVFTTSALHKGVRSIESVRDTLRLPAQGTKARDRYAASKFAQYAAAHAWALAAPVDVKVVAVSPGFIPTTGLNRESSWLGRFFLRWVLYWAPFCSTEAQGAQGLYHALSGTLPPPPPSGVLYLDNKGAVLEPSSLIAEGGQDLVAEWALGEEEIEGWETSP